MNQKKDSIRQLILGCGNKKTKHPENKMWFDVVTVDIDSTCNPDICYDLNKFPYPFDDNEFDEVHAYEILEHLGSQGDYISFFNLFNEVWRIMKKDSILYFTTPLWNSLWAWSDPGHTRIISEGSIAFLSQKEYEKQIGITSMTDYRRLYHGDFEVLQCVNFTNSLYCKMRCIK